MWVLCVNFSKSVTDAECKVSLGCLRYVGDMSGDAFMFNFYLFDMVQIFMVRSLE